MNNEKKPESNFIRIIDRHYFFFIFALTVIPRSLFSAEVVWSEAFGGTNVESVGLSYIGQVDSAVWLCVPIGAFWDTRTPHPTDPVEVTFPTFFVTGLVYAQGFEIPKEINNVLWSSRGSLPSVYDFNLGSGWIFHSRIRYQEYPSEHVFENSFGWVYIGMYPWIFGIDWGWRYVEESEQTRNSNSWWIYEEDYGWFWTTRDSYPSVYLPSIGWTEYQNP